MHLYIYATFTSYLGCRNPIEYISVETPLCTLRILRWWGKVLLFNCVLHGCIIIYRIDHSNLDRYFVTYIRKSLMRAAENCMVKTLKLLENNFKKIWRTHRNIKKFYSYRMEHAMDKYKILHILEKNEIQNQMIRAVDIHRKGLELVSAKTTGDFFMTFKFLFLQFY